MLGATLLVEERRRRRGRAASPRERGNDLHPASGARARARPAPAAHAAAAAAAASGCPASTCASSPTARAAARGARMPPDRRRRAARWARGRGRRRRPPASATGGATRPVRRILLPFTGQAISRRSFEAAVRLAQAENAVIMPAFLATVPRQLPLDAALPHGCERGMPLLEAVERSGRARACPSTPGSPRALLPRRAAAPARVRVVRPGDRPGHEHRGPSAEDVRWLLARPRGGPDPAPGSRRHALSCPGAAVARALRSTGRAGSG